MIREYALDPALVASDSNTLHRFFSEFGGEYGRVLADVPHQWDKSLQKLIQKMGFSTMERKSCFEELVRLKQSGLVKRDAQKLGDDTWLQRVSDLNLQEPFNGILSEARVAGSNQYDYSRMFGGYPDNWVIEQTQSVERTADKLANSIAQSLYFSKQFIFVDAYFNPLDERYRIPFMEFIKRIKAGRYSPKKVFVHTCEQPSDDERYRKLRADLIRGMKECIQPLLPSDFTVEMWIWPNQELHDRFVLTNVVGHAFGHGLDEATYQGAIEVNVNRLSASARAKEVRKFSRESGRIGDKIIVVGNE